MLTSSDCSASFGNTTILGMLARMALKSRSRVPKNGTTLQSRIANARSTADRYSLFPVSRDNRALDSVCNGDRSTSDSDNQNGLSFSDLQTSYNRINAICRHDDALVANLQSAIQLFEREATECYDPVRT